jgi:hypothetical protein
MQSCPFYEYASTLNQWVNYLVNPIEAGVSDIE